MKNLLLTLVVFSVLLLIGCQENSITDPMSPESINKDQISAGTLTSGTIPLEGILVVPGNGQTYYSIDGDINYTHQLVMSDPIPPAQQYHIYLDLSVNAELINTSQSTPVRLSISSDSEDIFYVSEEGIYILEKSFVVQGTNNELALVCRFIVTTENVSLNSKWLEVNAENELSKTGTTGDPLTLPPVQINKFQ
ncbi:MAG: hypothetical protein P8X47_00010 [Ignavibacteriaceae bacterium]